MGTRPLILLWSVLLRSPPKDERDVAEEEDIPEDVAETDGSVLEEDIPEELIP